MNELPEFPSFLRPLASYSYTHNGENLVRTKVGGGSSRASILFCTNSVAFNVTFAVESYVQMQIFNDWYFNVVEQGTRKFNIKLRPTGPLEDHVAIIIPGSLGVSGVAGQAPFSVTMQIEAEQIAAPFEGELYGLAEAGYSNLDSYFERIEEFANFDLI